MPGDIQRRAPSGLMVPQVFQEKLGALTKFCCLYAYHFLQSEYSCTNTSRIAIAGALIHDRHPSEHFQREPFHGTSHTFRQEAPLSRDDVYSLLQECCKTQKLVACRRLHALMVCSASDLVGEVWGQLIHLFTSHGCLLEANLVFCMCAKPYVKAWQAIISAHVMLGEYGIAFDLYQKMQEDSIEQNKIIVVCILKACGITGAIEHGKMIHKEIIRSGLESDIVIGSKLINMYAKCGNLSEAREAFDRLPSRNVVAWGAMIAGYAQHRHGLTALELFQKMQKEGIQADKVVLLCALKACGDVGALNQGKMIHDQIIRSGLNSDVDIGSTLVSTYAKCGNLEDACKVFDLLPGQNEVSWNAMIVGYVHNGYGFSALKLFEKMQQEGIKPGKVTFLCILKACSSIGLVWQGKVIHDHIIRNGLGSDLVLGSTLVNMYANCGSLEEARNLFDKLQKRNVVSWGAMIAGYSENGCVHLALGLFKKMQEEGVRADKVTFLSVLKACGNIGAVEQGKHIHEQIVKSKLEIDVAIGSSLVDMYAKCGSLDEADTVFNRLPTRNSVSWGALISGFVQHGHYLSALQFFVKMLQEGIKPDKVAFSCILKACGGMGDIGQGQIIHDLIIRNRIEAEIIVANTVVDMYAKCGALEEARKVFDQLEDRNLVTWNAMLTGYAEHGHGLLALELFEQMPIDGLEPGKVTFLSILKACESIGHVGLGKLIHNQIIGNGLETDVGIASMLVDMYAKCRSLQEARAVFESSPERSTVLWNAMVAGYAKCGSVEAAWKLFVASPCRDVISWNIMIAGYAQQGYGSLALEISVIMEGEGFKPDKITFLCMLQACGSVGAPGQGQVVHDEIMRGGFESDVFIGNALVDMYSKCGSLVEAHRVFKQLPYHDVASWGVMIAAHSQHGNFLLAGQCLEEMQIEGLKPVASTYSSILAACSHTVQVDEAYSHFKSLEDDHDMLPSVEHFNCIVDLLGRAGCLSEAESILKTMPISNDMTGWLSLLLACRMHRNVKLGRQCFDEVAQLDPSIASGYVLMSNIYAEAHMWEDFHEIQGLRKYFGALKKAAKAFIEVNNKVYEFIVGKKDHLQSDKIDAKVQKLARLMRQNGHVPQLNLALYHIAGEHKEIAG